MKITILGCGWSSGVPIVGCTCPVCLSGKPRNRRRRASILFEDGGRRVLVDTSPDLRAQLLDADVNAIDGVVYTHGHADHLHGIDDLRPLNYHMKRSIPAFGTQETLNEIRSRFGDACRAPDAAAPWLAPSLDLKLIEPGLAFAVGGFEFSGFEQGHGPLTTLGLRFRSAAYSTDVKELSETAFEALRGVELWIVDCAGIVPHPTHSHLSQTLGWIERVAPKRAVLTHMAHRLDYDELLKMCPPGVEPAYDGMALEL